MGIKGIAGLFLSWECSCIEQRHGCVRVRELTASAVLKTYHNPFIQVKLDHLPVD